jgi:hypothetical protein
MYPRLYQYTPIRWWPKPLTVEQRRAKNLEARYRFAVLLDANPQAALEEANAALDEASRQEEEHYLGA